ncbi:hypothetical protein VNI00_018249 [Paramarasmius palmivorus]|uniref:Uncharacterized protein n=1 Tax=Paramarasmius palmivorus TaxID=297713 RepID=A0AAW0AYW6_9AGAR
MESQDVAFGSAQQLLSGLLQGLFPAIPKEWCDSKAQEIIREIVEEALENRLESVQVACRAEIEAQIKWLKFMMASACIASVFLPPIFTIMQALWRFFMTKRGERPVNISLNIVASEGIPGTVESRGARN